MAKYQYLHAEERELRIALVGKTGNGKSTTGNTILGEDVFRSDLDSVSVTSVCQKERGEFEGESLAVVDTPGLFDTDKPQEEVIREISRSIILLAPGPHVFLIVLQPNRFTTEEQETVKIIKKILGENAGRYTMALFTHGDELKRKKVPIEKLIQRNQHLSDFISQCDGGYHVFNNEDQDPAQVRELLKKIKRMVQRNGGSCYTNDMFEKAEKAIKEEQESLMRENPHMTHEESRRQAEKSTAGEIAGSFFGSVASFTATGACFGPAGAAVGFILGSIVGAITAAVKSAGCVIQ